MIQMIISINKSHNSNQLIINIGVKPLQFDVIKRKELNERKNTIYTHMALIKRN